MEILIASTILGIGYLLSNNKTIENNNENPINVPSIEKKLVRENYEKQNTVRRDTKPTTHIHKSQLSDQVIEEFTHNNMEPYFGSHIRQNTDPNANEQILEKHIGTFKLKQQKEETNPFFDLVPESTVGSPNELYDHLERIIPSQKKQNEFPIEKLQVGPGLNDGYTHLPHGGVHQDDREFVRPKTVDELRVINNPKLSYKGRILSGQHITTNPGIQSEVSKNAPERSFDMGPDRFFTTIGATQKQTATKNIYMKNTNRQNPKEYTGIGEKSTKQPRISPEFKESTKISYLSSGNRNLQGIDQWNSNEQNADYGKKSIEIRDNERTNTLEKNHILNLTNIVKALISPLNDIFRTTKKENVIGNIRQSGNVSSSSEKPFIYDPNDVARTTIKETNIHNNTAGFMNIGSDKGPIQDPNDVARTTIKETNIHNNNNGYLESHTEKPIVYDPNDVARTTIKETNIHDIRTANIDKIEKKGTTHAQDDMKTTNRETTTLNNHLGNVNSGNAHTVVDSKQIARTTVKQTTISKGILNNAKGPNKLYVYNPNNVTKTTIKETTIDNARTGNLNHSRTVGGYLTNSKNAPDTNKQFNNIEYTGIMNNDSKGTDGYLVSNIQMTDTNRQTTSVDYTGGAGNVTNKAMSYSDKYNVNLNEAKEKSIQGRSPTTLKTKLFSGVESINMNTSKIDSNASRINNPDNISNIYQNKTGCEITTFKQDVNNESILNRTNPDILNAFKENPFTQPLTSY